MRGYFIITDKNFLDKSSGIGKKISKQIEIFNSNDIICEKYELDTGCERNKSLIRKIRHLNPFANVYPKWIVDEKFKTCDFIYFRRTNYINYHLIRFLKKIRISNSNIKIFMEIPTYPYDGEFRGKKGKYFLTLDKIFRTKLKNLVDIIFVIDPEKLTNGKLFSVKSVNFINGYDVINCKVRKYIKHDEIRLACVGMFSSWHGYERLIYGLNEYYMNGGKRKIIVDMVGEGSELSFYKKLIKYFGLEENFVFHGKCFGDKLDQIYSKTDIGIASLGRYKSGIQILGDLKTREYLAKGIPVISGCGVDIFESQNELEYYLQIPNCSNPVKIDDVIKFYEKIKEDRKYIDIEKKLHEFSLTRFDFNITMKTIMEEMKSEQN
ncbi:glycosyltransferase family protein [Longibaculum muris]|uniref:glycosyltransferase n=1 Tax=Longibaculum muris TaxID=1796628 RepID=UPI0022E7BF50|nr:glycosyltransferase [Longibaculum muris]